MKIAVLHPTANANVRAVIKGFAGAGLLYQFHTTIAFTSGLLLNKLGKVRLLSEINRRAFDPSLQQYIKTQPWKEFGRILSTKIGLRRLTLHEQGMFCIDAIYQGLDRHVANTMGKMVKGGVTTVYAYEDGALSTFKKANEAGLQKIYDLPIAYWQLRKKLIDEEIRRLPQWAKTFGGGINDSQRKFDRKEKELELADTIICPGDFVKNSLPPWAKNKNAIVATFGSPPDPVTTEWIQEKSRQAHLRPLRVLFAGSLSQRKGIADLFAAFRLLPANNIELIVMGSLMESMEFYKKQLNRFRYEPVRPHAEVLKLMRSCDVLCLPSIAEGRALVMQEAMSQGLPIIITENTGGSDLVIEGKTGFMVPVRSPYAIAEKMEWLLDNRKYIPEMAIAAKDHAAKYSWEKYSNTIVQSICNYSYSNTRR